MKYKYQYNKKTDIWGFGILTLKLYSQLKTNELNKIHKDIIFDMLNICLKYNNNERPNIDELENHRLFYI